MFSYQIVTGHILDLYLHIKFKCDTTIAVVALYLQINFHLNII